MKASPFFFANKLYLREGQVAYTCLEQNLHNLTRDLHLDVTSQVNTTQYSQSILVRNRLRPEDWKLKTHPYGAGINVERYKSRYKYW